MNKWMLVILLMSPTDHIYSFKSGPFTYEECRSHKSQVALTWGEDELLDSWCEIEGLHEEVFEGYG